MWPGRFDPDCTPWSFHHALPLLEVEPDAAPLLCVSFSAEWRPLICGAILQLLARLTWDQSDEAALYRQQERAYKLLLMFGLAEVCDVQEDGLFELTILAGDASASGAIAFSRTYAVPPKVDVSGDDPDLICSWGEVTTLGAILTITAATPVATDTSATISWSTNP